MNLLKITPAFIWKQQFLICLRERLSIPKGQGTVVGGEEGGKGGRWELETVSFPTQFAPEPPRRLWKSTVLGGGGVGLASQYCPLSQKSKKTGSKALVSFLKHYKAFLKLSKALLMLSKAFLRLP